MDARSRGGPQVWIPTMAGRHVPRRYREICRVVYRVIQDFDTSAGYMETIPGVPDLGWSGCSPGGAEMEQG
ncbi:hypothetical protein KI387_009277, partial [Taxus chinensis]